MTNPKQKSWTDAEARAYGEISTQLQNPKHNPLSWYISEKEDHEPEAIYRVKNDKESVALIVGTKEQAKFIVRACNSHYALVEACRKALSDLSQANTSKDYTYLEQALALAEGKGE